MIRRSFLFPLAPLALLAGCGSPNAPSAIPAPPPQKPIKLHEAGLERVIGRTGTQLVALFGEADLDSHEGAARRMQFVGPACVLDAYLMPAKTGAEAIVTYVDARLPSGEDMDRASCIAALSRRSAAP